MQLHLPEDKDAAVKSIYPRALLSLCSIIWTAPLFLLAVIWMTNPFAETLSRTTVSLTGLSTAQKCNIRRAVKMIDGVVVKPGESFSFNKVVGPRTAARGYRAAPSYLGPENPSTMGGGICLVSSAVYQSALQCGLKIDQRVAHLRTVRTVPPGLDATVWYGQADLSFTNTLSKPVEISAEADWRTVSVKVLGDKETARALAPIELYRIVKHPPGSQLLVEVFRRQGNKDDLVSRDVYTQ